MHVSSHGQRLSIGVNAFRDVVDTLRVWSGDQLVTAEPVELSALVPFRTTAGIEDGVPFRVRLPALGLDYSSDPSPRLLARPFTTDPEAWPSISQVERTVFEARELLKGRYYREARELFQAATEEEPWNRDALLGQAGLHYRMGLYAEGLERVNRALQLDAYDAEANFLAGILYQALHRNADARDALGWAARSVAYRSAANVQLAELMIGSQDWREARRYARLALDFDRSSVPALRALAFIGRKTQDGPLARRALQDLLALDPLHHFAYAEEFLAAGSAPGSDLQERLSRALGGEYPDQSLLELAIGYVRLGSSEDAATLLEWRSHEHPLLRAWLGYLTQDPTLLAESGDPAFVFPFRPESLPVLEWARTHSEHWAWTYLLALNLWALDRDDEAATHLVSLGDTPDFGPAYVARAQLLAETRGASPLSDLQRGVRVSPGVRALHVHLIRLLQESDDWDGAAVALQEARERFPEDFDLDLLQAKTLINRGEALDAVQILQGTHVLPSENARESHLLWEQAHTMAALDAAESGAYEDALHHLTAALQWPESLGQGRPYEPEERMVRFIQGRVLSHLGDQAASEEAYAAVLEGTGSFGEPVDPGGRIDLGGPLDLLALSALEALGPASRLETLASQVATDTEPGRFAERLAGAFAWGSVDAGDAARQLGAEFPHLFADLDGRLLLRALSLRKPPGSSGEAGGGGPK
jgi:tetratricopeptide (TPR) repeat protein